MKPSLLSPFFLFVCLACSSAPKNERAPSSINEQLKMKSYSLSNLFEDLQFILFDSFDRPWHGGLKYTKRVYRLFFLSIVEMLGSEYQGTPLAAQYLASVREKILKPLAALYPINDQNRAAAVGVKHEAEQLAQNYPGMAITNEFWVALGEFVNSRLLQKPLDDDQVGFKGFLEEIEKNLDTALKVQQIPAERIDPKAAYQVDVENLF